MDLDFIKEKRKLLKKICEDYNLDQEQVFAKYLNTKKRRSKKADNDNVHDEDYIETRLFESNGSSYLVDNIGNVFTYDLESPKVVGIFQNNVIRFYR